MPMIDVTALAGTEARISSVERGSVLQVHSASWPNRTARRAHILWISLTSSFRSTEPSVRLREKDARPVEVAASMSSAGLRCDRDDQTSRQLR
jgi:hypothetical protein